MELQKAEEKYEDAIAGGHSAMMMNADKDKKDMFTLNIGNIMPGEFATVHIDSYYLTTSYFSRNLSL